ncbi:hypothetical protein [Corynebacterium lubricantis]|uniref:hypothetical protein n=1 Tax=Corynebacterium lubricantis TaxID=541095 RepID=UPI000361C7F7|nr:hypothetical protein [Corynebacterium lubricantis]
MSPTESVEYQAFAEDPTDHDKTCSQVCQREPLRPLPANNEGRPLPATNDDTKQKTGQYVLTGKRCGI